MIMLRNSKSISKLFIVLLLLAVAFITLIGCGDDDKGNSTEPSPDATPTLPPGVMVSESLKDGQTSGVVTDGDCPAEFTAEGIEFCDGWWSLRYSIPRTPRGYLEFNARGFVHNELHGGSEFKSLLVSMWDAHGGFDYDFSRYIYEFRKFGAIIGHPAANAVDLRFKVDPNDWDHAENRPVLSWDRNRTYRFRVEWDTNRMAIYRDGEEVLSAGFRGEFAPDNHMIQIGSNTENPFRHRWKEAPHDLLISDVVIGTL